MLCAPTLENATADLATAIAHAEWGYIVTRQTGDPVAIYNVTSERIKGTVFAGEMMRSARPARVGPLMRTLEWDRRSGNVLKMGDETTEGKRVHPSWSLVLDPARAVGSIP